MMSHYSIRLCIADDISFILSMVKDLSDAHTVYDGKRFIPPSSNEINNIYKQWIARTKLDETLCLIAFDANVPAQPIGYAVAEKFDAQPEYWSASHIYIHDIYCTADARKTGLGKAFIAHIEQWAKLNNIHQIRGLVATQNQASLDFFEKQGFRPCATEIAYDIER